MTNHGQDKYGREVNSIQISDKITRYTVSGDGLQIDADPTEPYSKVLQTINSHKPSSLVTTPVPKSVTPLQMRLALRDLNLYDSVVAILNNADVITKESWEYAIEYRRDHPLIAKLAAILGKTDKEIDDIFIYADSLS